jgi:hypothetical protein
MAGGTRIVAFDSASTSASGDEILLTDEVLDPSAEAAEWGEENMEAPRSREWLLPMLAAAMLLAWTAFFGWAMRDRLSGATPVQWIALLRDWGVPVLLGAVGALLVLRNSRHEALRFGDAARMLSDESSRLETRLAVVNRELSLAREFIAAQSRDLETLGRLASDRLSREADRLQDLIRDNHARVETIGTVSETALDNMEKLRGQLPVIASSAKDVTNNIATAGRTAASQLQDMLNGFAKLNDFGQASERQVHTLRHLVDETIAEFTHQADQFGDIATARFAAFHESSAEFRTQLESHEIEALAAIRSRARAMAEELDQTREALDGQEAESLTSMRARLSALRDEGTAISRALRDGESRALESWHAGVARMRDELQSALVALAEWEAEAAEANKARVAAIGEDLARLDRENSERGGSFAAELDQRRAAAAAEETAAASRLQAHLAALDDAIAARRARHGEIDAEATALLRERFAALDGEMADRRARHEAQGQAIAAQAEAIAMRLDEFERRAAEIAVHGNQAEAALAASLRTLTDRLAASRSALAGTDSEVVALTESSVRLLELIQASVKHSSEELPQALAKGEVRLAEVEVRMAALREAANDTDARGLHLATTIATADENLRRTCADLATLQAGLEAAGSAHGATLAGLRQELDGIAAQGAQLAEEARTRLAAALEDLSRSAHDAVAGFGESGSAAVAALAHQLASETSVAIERAMRTSVAETSAKLEHTATHAAAVSREAALQLRDQLAKVNELAGNLESRVAHARQRAEEQVDNDFTRRVALITESLNSNAIDIAKTLSSDVADTAWAAYLRGDRGIFTRRAVSLIENVEAKAIVQIYDRDRDFHEHVSRYIHDFEAMLRQVLSARDGQALGVTLLSSDMGKLYVALAQAIERLRA